MVERPAAALRRLSPDPVQLQVIVGSLLGDGEITGPSGARRLAVVHADDAYARWKYDRLGAFAADSAVRAEERTTFTTIAHPLFDDLARLDRAALLRVVGPLGAAVWLRDLARLELRPDCGVRPDDAVSNGSARSGARGRPRASCRWPRASR